MRPVLHRYGLELALCVACCCGTLLLDGGRARTELLWGDEIVSVHAIQQSLGGLIEHRYWQGHSPLYFMLLKSWIFVSSGADGLGRPGELLLRLPSLVFMGLAGGLLAATAWRAWGVAAGMLLLGLWLGNNLVERFAVEARPYALLVLFLAAAVWSSTRLWLADETDRSTAFGAIAVCSRILAAATIPVGVIAVLAMEACSLGVRGANAYNRFWRYRSFAVVAGTIIILVLYIPAIAFKSVGYWVEAERPLSWTSLGNVTHDIFLNGAIPGVVPAPGFLAAVIVAVLALYGLVLNRQELPARLAAGLAFALPVILIFISSFSSLMVTRYFVAAVPGVLLLAASVVSRTSGAREKAIALAVACSAVVMLVEDRGFMQRPRTYLAHMELIESLQPEEILGMADSWAIMTNLAYYLPNRTGLRIKIEYRNKPIAAADLPENSKLYWFFNTRGPDSERAMIGELPVLCRYSLPQGNILVLGRSRAALPASMRDCPPYDGRKQRG